MKQLFVNPDISKASCLEPSFYLDPYYFEASKELIFARSWQFAGLKNSGNNISRVDLLEGFLDEPLIVVGDNEIRCLSNVCTHRGNMIVGSDCTADGLRCGYHGRRFDLHGKFVSMPGFEGVRDFPTETDDLRSHSILAEWAQMRFVSLDPVAGFDVFFQEITREVRRIR